MMTSQSPRIYIYKITFEEVPYYYYGVHKEKRYNEYYMGTPITNKWCWELYTPKKQILQLFDFTDEGWVEAQEVEQRLIKPFYNTDKWCLNEFCGGKTSLEICRRNGIKVKENGTGVFSFTPEQRSENSKKAGKIGGKIGGNVNKKNKTGVCGRSKEKMREDAKIGGKKAKELGVGVHGRTKEQMSEDGRMGGKKTKELGVGVHGRTKEQMSEDGKKGGIKGGKIGGKMGSKITNSQKWMCLETGYITTSGPLTAYQRKRGINTSKRRRIS